MKAGTVRSKEGGGGARSVIPGLSYENFKGENWMEKGRKKYTR